MKPRRPKTTVELQSILAEAREEVLAKSHARIEEDTAWKWAARAIACHALWKETREDHWIEEAEDYRHEAIEHAAFANDGVLATVRRWIETRTG